MIESRHRATTALGILLLIIFLGSAFGSIGFQRNSVLSANGQSSNCPLNVFFSGGMLYVKNCYYEIGVSETNFGITYAAINDGSNQSVTTKAGLLAEELDIEYGGTGSFTNGTVSLNVNTSSLVEIGISGEIVEGGVTFLTGVENLTFFSNEPYFIGSLSSSIQVTGPHNSHDIANWVNPNWFNAWAGTGSKGETEVCSYQPPTCTNYVEPESTFDTSPDIKSSIQTNGPTWGWLGTSASNTSSAEGIGFLLLGFNSTSPDEAAITHLEIKGVEGNSAVGDWEIEGTGVDPADYTSNYLDPHALQYSASVNQTMYTAILIYLNAVPWSTFYHFIHGAGPSTSIWKGAEIGSFLGSSTPYAAFAEAGRSPNVNDQDWYITNLATTATAPGLSYQDAMLYFTGRNDSLSNNFPLKMSLEIDGSTNPDWNFGNPAATVIANDGTNAKLQVVWNDPSDGLQLSTNFSTRSDSDKMNVTGTLTVTGSSLRAQTVALEANLFANYLDGNGLPNRYLNTTNSLTTSNLYWDYTNVGISILLPSGNGFLGGVSSNQDTGYLNLVNSSSTQTFSNGHSFPFSFAVSFYDPVSEFSPAYNENIYVPTLKMFTQPFGNATQVGFTEDNSRVFSDMQSATEFDSNNTIASMQFISPFSGDLEVYYAGQNPNAVYVQLGSGQEEPASQFYNAATKVFNFNIESPVESVTMYMDSSPITTTTTTQSQTSNATMTSSTTTSTSLIFNTITTTTTSQLGCTFACGSLDTDLVIAAIVVAIVIVAGTMLSVNYRKR